MDVRIDSYATHEFAGYRFRQGKTLPFGASVVSDGVNFSIFSSRATACSLVLFESGAPLPLVEIDIPPEFRIGDVYAITVFDLPIEEIEYGFRFDGPSDPHRGLRYDRTRIVADPYARVMSGRDVWRQEPDWTNVYPHRSRVSFDDFDWEGDRPLEHHMSDLVMYELHVRGFTAHPSSGVSAPGTFAGLREKIPYLKQLGVNCVELLPVFEFDEWENSRTHPDTGEWLGNYWGYSTLGFFAPKAGYASTGRFGMQIDEFKALVKDLHANGIEIILDVVFNHTAEGDHRGPTISFRGIDNTTYYMLTPEGWYYNFSGCGNTFNCNHPVVRAFVVDCLRYWAWEYHIDGFRFDLASILGRDENGAPLANPPLLESLAYDPVLSKCKLIAEAWDAGGLYQVGSFPAYGRWAEWNGKFRDAARSYLRSEPGTIGEIAARVQGSPDLYPSRGPSTSVNFITAHDGFTLADLFAYNEKHNAANGEHNSDGSDDNGSWNCGVEGPTGDPAINALRLRLAKNAMAILLFSQGVPMLVMGDEFGRTQNGNNNVYCHDNNLAWVDWTLAETNGELLAFTQHCIALRAALPVVRSPYFPNSLGGDSRDADITFVGTDGGPAEWAGWNTVLAYRLRERSYREGVPGDELMVMFNMHWEDQYFQIAPPTDGSTWYVLINTAMPSGADAFQPLDAPQVNGSSFIAGPRSVVVLISGSRRH